MAPDPARPGRTPLPNWSYAMRRRVAAAVCSWQGGAPGHRASGADPPGNREGSMRYLIVAAFILWLAWSALGRPTPSGGFGGGLGGPSETAGYTSGTDSLGGRLKQGIGR